MKTDIAEKALEVIESKQDELPDKLEFILQDKGFEMKSDRLNISYSEKIKSLRFERERDYVKMIIGEESSANVMVCMDNFDINNPRITSISLRKRFRFVDSFYRDKNDTLLSFLRMHDTIEHDGNVPENKMQKYLSEEQFKRYDKMLNKLFEKYDFNYYYNLYHSKTAA
jgi:hypothetical protein